MRPLHPEGVSHGSTGGVSLGHVIIRKPGQAVEAGELLARID